MRLSRIVLTIVLAFAGCKGNGGLGPKVENPVVGPPPPRKLGATNSQHYAEVERDRDDEKSHRGNGVQLTASIEPDRERPRELEGNRVIATVNGAPIFEAELLFDLFQRYPALAEERDRRPEAEYRKLIDVLIERHLRTYVEQKLLAETLRRSLKKDQQKQLDGFMKKHLQGQFDQMKEKEGVTSTAELDQALQKRGMSLAMIEYKIRTKIMAEQFIASKVKNNQKISRQDLFAYYQQHLKEYEVKHRVKWQQILISRANEQQARAKLRILSDGLLERPPRDFGELAVELSDGPTAENKGIYDWTNAGSLTDEKLEALLFKLPIGEPSDLIESPRNYQMVRVLERQEAGHIPFDEVQDQIRNKLQDAGQQEEISTLIDELWATATIDSQYDIQGYKPPGS